MTKVIKRTFPDWGNQKRTDWKTLIASLPAGLTFKQAAQRLGKNYYSVRRALRFYGYCALDGRHTGQINRRKVDPAKLNWKLSNIALGRKYGMSRERFRKIRLEQGIPVVESRGRKPL